MNVKKFVAGSSREALRLVRDALGPDALILSNRNVDGMVEIMALSGEIEAMLAAPPTLAAQPIEPPRPSQESGSDMTALISEIRSMRSLLQTRIDAFTVPLQAERTAPKPALAEQLQAAGFSAGLAHELIRQMHARGSAKGELARAQAILAANLMTLGERSKFLDKGGVYALVGPTGVGKTTTTAKLAARCVMRHGSGKLALVTTDSYRIGAHEQLRIYGKILGVMAHAVKDEADLRIALAELKNKHTILIDTVGMSQRDRMVSEQIALLSGAGAEVQRLLCLNATSSADTLDEVVRAYRGNGLAGCIITKLDEAASIGGVLEVVMRHKLNLICVADGQRVPEDLQLANSRALIKRAFTLPSGALRCESQDDELTLLPAHAPRTGADARPHEVRRG